MNQIKQMKLILEKKWAIGARKILEIIPDLKQNLQTVIFLRHSAREEPEGFLETLKAPLTEEGREIAREFGTLLPKNWQYRVFTSPVNRCKNSI